MPVTILDVFAFLDYQIKSAEAARLLLTGHACDLSDEELYRGADYLTAVRADIAAKHTDTPECW